MSCQNKLCKNLVISNSVTFTSPNLIINIPAGTYNNGQKYCIVVGQDIPDTTTIAATVGITIGSGTTVYPLVNCNCTNASACEIAKRRIYPCVVRTNIQSGVFKLLDECNCCKNCTYTRGATSIPIETTTTTPTTEEGQG